MSVIDVNTSIQRAFFTDILSGAPRCLFTMIS
jgi:hypothetical protein